MMIDVVVVVVLFAIMLIVAGAGAFSELPRDMRDVFCFLVMLAVGVAIVLVSIVGGA